MRLHFPSIGQKKEESYCITKKFSRLPESAHVSVSGNALCPPSLCPKSPRLPCTKPLVASNVPVPTEKEVRTGHSTYMNFGSFCTAQTQCVKSGPLHEEKNKKNRAGTGARGVGSLLDSRGASTQARERKKRARGMVLGASE